MAGGREKERGFQLAQSPWDLARFTLPTGGGGLKAPLGGTPPPLFFGPLAKGFLVLGVRGVLGVLGVLGVPGSLSWLSFSF